MDVGSVASEMAQGVVGAQVDVGVLKAVQNLDQNVAAELFASIGLGSGVDASA